MTRKEFSKLNLEKQLNTIKNFGEIIGTIERSEESLICYSIDLFFVEVVYSTKEHDLLRIVNFDQGRQLDKYSNLGNKI